VREIRRIRVLELAVKMSPNVGDIVNIHRLIEVLPEDLDMVISKRFFVDTIASILLNTRQYEYVTAARYRRIIAAPEENTNI